MDKVVRIDPNSVFRQKLAFSRVVRKGNCAFVSATGPTDEHGNLAAFTAYDQTRHVISQIDEALSRVGFSLDSIVRIRLYIRSFADQDEIFKAQHEVFDPFPPACSVLCVNNFHVPGMHVYMEADAVAEDVSPAEP